MKTPASLLGILAVIGILSLGLTQSAKANLIVNGGFETGDFTGWIVTTGSPNTFVSGSPHTGVYAAWSGAAAPSDCQIGQIVPTAPGTYTIDFWLANLGDGPNHFYVYWASTLIFSLTDAAAFDYTHYSFDLTGYGGDSLTFEFSHDPSYWLIDDVGVVSAPDAGSTLPLLCFAFLGVATLRRKLNL